jgi:RNA polymerase sigma factor (sigma-70 family)
MWSLSDEALLAGLSSGDRQAATAFVRRFQARVYGLAKTMIGDRSAAEEIAQEALLRAWRHASAYDPRRGAVATWLLSITRNLAIDHLRMKRPDPVEPERLAAIEQAVRDLPAQGEEPSSAIALQDLVGGLPDEQRRALLLAALFGYTAADIGVLEGIPLGTAKTRIRTAMQRVRSQLEAHDER